MSIEQRFMRTRARRIHTELLTEFSTMYEVHDMLEKRRPKKYRTHPYEFTLVASPKNGESLFKNLTQNQVVYIETSKDGEYSNHSIFDLMKWRGTADFAAFDYFVIFSDRKI